MPQQLSEDPKMTLVDLVENNFDTSNIPSHSDNIQYSTGWWDSSNKYPQIAVTNREDTQEGWSFADAGGQGPGRTEQTQVRITAFATRKDGEPNPKDMAHNMIEEVTRVLSNNIQSVGDFFSISWDGPRELPPNNPSTPNTVFAFQVVVNGKWHKTTY